MINSENLAEYFARRWFKKPSAREICFVNEILELSFGKNGLYFITKTDELINMKIRHNNKISPSVLDEFKITGEAEEDGVIAHAGMIWSLLNGEPWPEAVYHDYVERLVKGGSELSAYVAARLWPARGLIEKVQYRPISNRMDTGNLSEEDCKDILIKFNIKNYLFEESYSIPYFIKYRNDFNINLYEIHRYYLKKFGFSHPACALVTVHEIDDFFIKKVRENLEKDNLSDEMHEALLFLYLHLKFYIKTFQENKLCVSKFLLDLQENLDSFIKNIIKKCTSSEQKIKDFLSIEPKVFKKFINQFLALYSILRLELLGRYIVNNFEEEFYKKIAGAMAKLSEDDEDIFKNIYFIGENLIEIIKYMNKEEKTKIEKYIKKRLDENKTKELLAKMELFNIFLNQDKIDNYIKELEKVFSIKEITKLAIKNIIDVREDLKIKILEEITKKEFGESNLKKNKVKKDLHLILKIRSGLYDRDIEIASKYGFILYLEMKKKYRNFYSEDSEDNYLNICREIANKMHVVFRDQNEQNNESIFFDIIYALQRIYFGNFINREEETKFINLLLERINANIDYIYKNLTENQSLLIDLRKIFILNIEKLIKYKNIDNIMDILMIRKNCNIYFI